MSDTTHGSHIATVRLPDRNEWLLTWNHIIPGDVLATYNKPDMVAYLAEQFAAAIDSFVN